MLLFLKLFLAHLIGDFVLQSDKSVKEKEKKKIRSVQFYVHILIHTFLLFFFLEFNRDYLYGILFIVSSHAFIDLSKLYLQNKKNKRILFFVDQFLHICILFVCAYYYEQFNFSLQTLLTLPILLFSVCLLSVTFVSAILIKITISKWNPESKKHNELSLAKAGTYIGILERIFVFVFVITDHWEAIGFLIAAKSILRFGDLKAAQERRLTEYILIGTLLSFGVAIAMGLLYIYLLNNFAI